MFVCLFWSTMLAIKLCTNRRPSIDGQKKELDKPHTLLLIFMLTATVLYFGHCVFFNHNTSIIPFTDTLYCTANLSVYPIYYLYICSLTIRREHYKERAIILLPALGGVSMWGCSMPSCRPKRPSSSSIATFITTSAKD